MEPYIVQFGDTLSSIAFRRLGNANRWSEIARLNRLQPPYMLFVGQRLDLPSAQAGVTSGGIMIQNNAVQTDPANEQIPASLALARGFMFVVFEQLPEVGTGRVIRKVAAIPRDFALNPPNPLANLSLADHVLGNNNSQFLSASNRPFGAPNFRGQPLLIDVAKTRAAGGQIYSVEQIVTDLRRFAHENPASEGRVNTLIRTIQSVEGEVLIEGGVPRDAVRRVSTAHTGFIRTADELWASFDVGRITRPQLEAQLLTLEKAYGRARIFGRVGRVVTIVGVVFTVVDIADATQRSMEKNSYKPLAAETVRQIGGWGGAVAGGKIGFLAGAALGVETGPGLILTGAVGAIIFGAAGYFGADFIADWIEQDTINELREDNPSNFGNGRGGAVTMVVNQGETQYLFSRRALIHAAALAGLSETDQTAFVDAFFPLNSNPETMANFKLNWISGDPNPADGASMRAGEFSDLIGREFTFQLNEAQIAGLVGRLRAH